MLQVLQFIWGIKLLWAPLQDIYFLKIFGKRKTYVVIIQFIFCIQVYYASFKISSWIENGNILEIFLQGASIFLLFSLCEISADAWCVKLVNPSYYGILSYAAALGFEIGGIFSFDIFLLLNSDDFCTKKFGLKEKILDH